MNLRIVKKVKNAPMKLVGSFLGAPVYGWRHRLVTRVRAGLIVNRLANRAWRGVDRSVR